MPAISGPETFNSQFVVAANGQVSLATPPFSTAGGTINGQVVIRAPASSAPVLTVSSNTSTVLPTPQPNTLIQFANADAGAARVLIDGYNGDPTLTFRRSGGTAIAQTPIVAGNNIGFINALGYGTNAYGTGRTYIQMTAAEAWTNTAQGAYLAFGTTPIGTVTTAEAMRIDNTGFVGIGIAAPPVKLTVSSNVSPLQPGIIGNLAVGGADGAIARITIDAYGSGGFPHLNFRAAAGTAAAPSAVISGQEIGRINATGYFVATYSSPRTSIVSYAMETWATGAQGAAIAFQTTPTGTQATAEVMRINPDGGLTLGAATGGSKGLGTLNATGVYANNVLLTSDAGLKTDIKPLADGLSVVSAIEPKIFRWKGVEGAPLNRGFLAQEIAKLLGGDDTTVDLGSLVALLWSAFKELNAKVAALEGATVH